jgi:hypothetical protein
MICWCESFRHATRVLNLKHCPKPLGAEGAIYIGDYWNSQICNRRLRYNEPQIC